MILVVGATGLLGSEICRRLRERGRDVRALVRPDSPREASLRALGVDIAIGDLRDRGSLVAACRDVDAVISTATAMGSKDRTLTLNEIDRKGQLRLVDVARQSGVHTFVYLSLSPNLAPRAPLVRYKREVERAVRLSGMRWTILQPTAYMEVWLGPQLGWNHVAGRAIVFGSGKHPVPWISVADVAEHAIRALDDPRLANVDLPLGGPEMLTPHEVVRIFAQASGRRYSTLHVPRILPSLFTPLVELFHEEIASGMSMGAQTSLGDPIDSPLQRELELPLTTVREYAARIVRRRNSS
ncbi:MAG TPA: SDR family oxidoreductase [Gemmatimonadaceae bacterium]